MKKYIFLLLSLTFITSCSSDEIIEEEQEVIDYDTLNEEEIQNYIAENNLVTEKSDSGLYYIIDEEGTGKTPSLSSNVTVYYKGYTTDSVVFDESPEEGIDFDLNRVIPGFAEGLTLLKENGEATLIIPSKIGYPPNYSFGPASFLAGKVIIFEVKLISVN